MIGLVLLLALTGCQRTSCVDETGYEDCSGPKGDTTGSGADSPSDDAADGLWYTAAAPLGATPVDVSVLGEPGVLGAATSVALSVGSADAVPVVVVDGGFVGVVTAALGDTVHLVPDVGAARQLVLLDDLSAVEGASSDAAGGGTGGVDGAPSGPPVVADTIDVGDGALSWVAAPYVAWVAGRPAVARVGTGESASLPAASGESLCVARLDGTGEISPQRCVTLP